MTYEIQNADLFDLFRNRPCRSPRRRDSAIVWPHPPGAVPEIPFSPYNPGHVRKWWAGELVRLQEQLLGGPRARDHLADAMRKTFLAADVANRRCETYISELNRQRGLGNVVQPPVMPPRRNGRRPDIDGKRAAAGQWGDDMCALAHREAREAAKTRWKACKNKSCQAWLEEGCGLCLDRQRAGTCPTQSGSNLRSDSGGHASIGG